LLFLTTTAIGHRSGRAGLRAAAAGPRTNNGETKVQRIAPARGFTMVELAITLAIAALLATMAAPPLNDLVRSARLSAAAREINADLVLARREAIKRNTRVLVCPIGATAGKCGTDFTKWASGWLVCYDRDVDGVCDDTVATDPNPIRQHGALDTQMKVTGPTAAVRFNADGTQGAAGAATLETFKVTRTGSTKTYTATVAATGNVALKKPS
jgi:type IV fimbrial biogenesis protein FimT